MTARLLCFASKPGVIPEDDGKVREVAPKTRSDWNELVERVLDVRSCTPDPMSVTCAPQAREVFRQFHNEAVRLRN